MRPPRSSNDTSRLGHIKKYSSTKEGESSKSGEEINVKPKVKPTCYHCGRIGHIGNICGSRIVKKKPKPKFISNYFHCKKQGHQAHECRSKVRDTPIAPRFDGYCYNF